MKKKQRKSYTAFKVKIALEAIKGQRTINEIGAHYGVCPNMAPQWKKQATLESARCLLNPAGTRRPRGRSSQSGTLSADRPAQSRTRLAQKKLVCSTDQKRQLIEPDNDSISVCRLGTTRLLFSSSSK
jgi:transposase-like protein